MNTLFTGLAALALLVATPLAAQETSPHAGHAAPHGVVALGALELSGAFTRATLPNQPVGGGYVTIVNTGAADDRLIAASSPAAGRVEIHEMRVDNDVMTMRALDDGLVIPAGETVTLAPGGLHLMLMELAGPIVEGETIVVTFDFEVAGSVEVALIAAGAGARTAPDGAAHGDDHGGHAGH